MKKKGLCVQWILLYKPSSTSGIKPLISAPTSIWLKYCADQDKDKYLTGAPQLANLFCLRLQARKLFFCHNIKQYVSYIL